MGLLSCGNLIIENLRKAESTAGGARCTFSVTAADEEKKFAYPFQKLHALLDSLGLLHIGVYIPFNRKYEMVFNHGFDYDTTLQGVSSVDFWKGTFDEQPEENTWYTQSGTRLDSFLQLFSIEDRSNISQLHVKFFNADAAGDCILIAAQQNTTAAVTDYILDSLDDNFSEILPHVNAIANLYVNSKKLLQQNENDYMDKIPENCIENELAGTLVQIDLSLFRDELCIRNTRTDSGTLLLAFISGLAQKLPENSICAAGRDGTSAKFILFSENEIELEPYCKQLLAGFEPQFSQNELGKIAFSFAGSTSEPEELYSFIKK